MSLLILGRNFNRDYLLAIPQFFLRFLDGLAKPLSKASSGQASMDWLIGVRHGRNSCLPGNIVLNPKEVLANEAFPKGSPRPPRVL
jgi:hypothetical protein